MHNLENLKTDFDGAADVIMQLHSNFVKEDQLKYNKL